MRAGAIPSRPIPYLSTVSVCRARIINRLLLHPAPDAVPALETGSRLDSFSTTISPSCTVPSPPRRPVCPSSQPASQRQSLVLPGLSHHSTVADPRTGQGARARGLSRSLTDLLHKNFTIHQIQRHHHLFSSLRYIAGRLRSFSHFLPTWSSKPTRGELDLPSQSPAI